MSTTLGGTSAESLTKDSILLLLGEFPNILDLSGERLDLRGEGFRLPQWICSFSHYFSFS